MMTVLRAELALTVFASITFIGLFVLTSAGYSSAESGVRSAYWHLIVLTAVGMLDVGLLLLVVMGVRVPSIAAVVVYGFAALVVVHRNVMVIKANWFHRDTPDDTVGQ